MEHLFVSIGVAFAALFAVVDPIGAVPTFLAITRDRDRAWVRRQAFLAAVTSAAMLFVFLVIGNVILEFFGISLAAVEVVGGLIIGYVGWDMAVGHLPEVDEAELDRKDVYFHPMAFPMLAGPGALAVVLSLSNRADDVLDFPGFAVGIAAVCLVSFLAIWAAGPIARRLGPHGIEVLNRVMGLIVLAIAAELVFHGIADEFGLRTTEE